MLPDPWGHSTVGGGMSGCPPGPGAGASFERVFSERIRLFLTVVCSLESSLSTIRPPCAAKVASRATEGVITEQRSNAIIMLMLLIVGVCKGPRRVQTFLWVQSAKTRSNLNAC